VVRADPPGFGRRYHHVPDRSCDQKCPAEGKPYKLTDERSLFLLVMPNGAKYWRMRYRYLGKQKTLSLGV
jgi:hypothetical protein